MIECRVDGQICRKSVKTAKIDNNECKRSNDCRKQQKRQKRVEKGRDGSVGEKYQKDG